MTGAFFGHTDKPILKCIYKGKGSEIAELFLKEEKLEQSHKFYETTVSTNTMEY